MGGVEDEGGDCLQGAAESEGWDAGCVAVIVGEAAVGGWPRHVDEGCPVWGSAHRQVVHGGAHNPGSPGRSSRPLPRTRLLHLCLPNEAGDDDPDGQCHGGPVGRLRGVGPGLGEAQEKSGEGPQPGPGPGLGVCPGAPQVARAWPYGPQGSK